jgi:hypothetical protein
MKERKIQKCKKGTILIMKNKGNKYSNNRADRQK